MGFIESVSKSFDRMVSSVEKFVGDGFREIKERVSNVVEMGRQGRWMEAVESGLSTINELTKHLLEVPLKALDAVEQITEVRLENLNPILDGLKIIGEAAVETVEKHPREWLSIAFSFIAAVVMFAIGDIRAGIGFLVAGITKTVNLFEMMEAEDPGFAERHPLPPEFKLMAEPFKEIPADKVDEVIQEKVAEIDPAEA